MIKLNEEILEEINSKVDCFYELIINKYKPTLYREDIYERLIRTFSNPSSVTPSDIEEALRWKYGKSNGQRLAPNHTKVLCDFQSGWGSFVAKGITSPEDSHDYWMCSLNRKTVYISVSYIIHLIYCQSHKIPIIDRFSWAATRYFLSLGNVDLPKRPIKFSHIELLREFIIATQ